MPFRRKNRNPLFGSSRSGDKENANVENMQEPLLSQPTGLFRCHSDNSQRFCCDVNPNTMGTHQHHPHRNSVLSTKEKMSNLLQLNSTLVKEVASLRASQLSLNINMEDLSEQLRTKSFTANALMKEKEKLAVEVNQLEKAHCEEKESLTADKKDVEDRLECVTLVLDNLQNMNGVLAEEAARLREEADSYVTEKHNLLADLDNILGEKSVLEELVDSLRASEEAFRAEMQQALQKAESEKQALREENKNLLAEKNEFLVDKEELHKEVVKLGSEKAALLSHSEDLLMKNSELEGERDSMVEKHSQATAQLKAERQASMEAQKRFNDELLASKSELEKSLIAVREEHQHAKEKFKAEKQVVNREAKQLALDNAQLAREKEELQKSLERKMQAEVAMGKVLKEKVKVIEMLQDGVDTANSRIDSMEVEHGTWKTKEVELQSNILALECKLSLLGNSLDEAIAQAKAKGEEAHKQKTKLDIASLAITSLEGKLAMGKDKQKCLEAYIQTLKGDLLVAEDAAIQAKSKANAVEKEAGIAIEKKTREASQKIGALESKLAAMVERQNDLENHVRAKENALKVAVQAESVAKTRLNGLVGGLQEKGKGMEGYFELLKAAMVEVQNNAMKAQHGISSLQADFESMMDVKVSATWSNGNGIGKKKQRVRRRAKVAQAHQSSSLQFQKKP